MAVLQCGRKFEAVTRHDSIIGIGRRHHRRRVGGCRFYVVVWRVLKQRFELSLIVAAAVFIDPKPAGGELVEPEHVHHAHAWQAGSVKIGPLSQASAD